MLLRLLALVAIAAPAAAQIVPPPQITNVPQRPSFEPNGVRILGSNLGLVATVRVDGAQVAIARNTGNRIITEPIAPRAPGFVPVQIFSPLGNSEGVLELTPTLKARRSLGTSLSVRLNAGTTGSYVLRATYEPFLSGVAVPGVHHLSFIPFGAGTTSVLRADVFPSSAPVTFQMLRPYYVGLIGAPITLQAQCLVGVAEVPSFTNAVLVP